MLKNNFEEPLIGGLIIMWGCTLMLFFKRKSDVETIIPGDLDVLERENQKEFQVAIGFKQLFSEDSGLICLKLKWRT